MKDRHPVMEMLEIPMVTYPVPLPNKLQKRSGSPFRVVGTLQVNNRLDPATVSKISWALERVAADLNLGLVEAGDAGDLTLLVKALPAESYKLQVDSQGITLIAGGTDGFFRALATLRQLARKDSAGTVSFAPILIEDSPRYSWRGLSLDVARSFFPVSEVKRVVDLLARYRMNRLHLHLSDDQGWRMEIPARPRLAELSGATAVRGGRSGFYTAADLKEITEYAERWGISVVPELDVPGHTNSATHAYGELTLNGRPTSAYTGTDVGFSRLFPGLPTTKPFLEDIFGDAARQSGADYLHVGGDEAYQINPQDYAELVEESVRIVRDHGKTPVVWQEAAKTDLPDEAIVQYWDPRADLSPIIGASTRGARVLMSPANRAYLDMPYDEETPYGQDWAGIVKLRTSYEWEPTDEIPGVLPASIVGVEAAIWTEKIHTFDQLSYMLLPRLAAVAEVGWTHQNERDWEDFTVRIAKESRWWSSAGFRWHGSPEVTWQ